MSPSRIVKAGALALALASTASATKYAYTCTAEDTYSGETGFFSKFDHATVGEIRRRSQTKLNVYRPILAFGDM